MNSTKILLACVVGLCLQGTGCSQKEEKPSSSGGFGEPKAAPDDGMVRKPVPPPEAPPDFTKALTISPSYDAAGKLLTVSLDIAEGFHAYAPGEEIGQPVSLQVDEASGWKKGETQLPAGKKKDLGTLGISMILEGKVDVKAPVSGGKGDITGKVRVQVCTKKVCDRPRPHPFKVAMQMPKAP